MRCGGWRCDEVEGGCGVRWRMWDEVEDGGEVEDVERGGDVE